MNSNIWLLAQEAILVPCRAMATLEYLELPHDPEGGLARTQQHVPCGCIHDDLHLFVHYSEEVHSPWRPEKTFVIAFGRGFKICLHKWNKKNSGIDHCVISQRHSAGLFLILQGRQGHISEQKVGCTTGEKKGDLAHPPVISHKQRRCAGRA